MVVAAQFWHQWSTPYRKEVVFRIDHESGESPMGLCKWSISNFEYGRKVVSSGLEGARSGREAFLNGRSLTPFLSESVNKAWTPAVVGAWIGMVGGIPGNRKNSISKVLVRGLVGGALGFGLAVAWESRRLTESVRDGALRNIHKVRDEHWLETHPIDYA